MTHCIGVSSPEGLTPGGYSEAPWLRPSDKKPREVYVQLKDRLNAKGKPYGAGEYPFVEH